MASSWLLMVDVDVDSRYSTASTSSAFLSEIHFGWTGSREFS